MSARPADPAQQRVAVRQVEQAATGLTSCARNPIRTRPTRDMQRIAARSRRREAARDGRAAMRRRCRDPYTAQHSHVAQAASGLLQVAFEEVRQLAVDAVALLAQFAQRPSCGPPYAATCHARQRQA
jgi:hypothetical protein